MKNVDLVKLVGFAGMVLGGLATLITGWSQQQTMEKTIEEKVNEALEKRNLK